VLVVDSGNLLPDLSSAKDREKARLAGGLLVRACERMGTVAVNVGPAEVSFGPAFFREAPNREFPWVSSNILDEKGKPLFRPYVLKEVRGIRIAVVGVAGPELDPRVRSTFGGGCSVDDPVRSVRRVTGELSGRADVIILLASMPDEEIQGLAGENPGVCFIIGGEGDTVNPPYWIGKIPVVYAGIDGKYLGRLELTCGKGMKGFVDSGRETGLRKEIDDVDRRKDVLEKARRNKPTETVEKMIGELAARKSKLEMELNQVCSCSTESGKFLWEIVPMESFFPEDPEVLQWMKEQGLEEAHPPS